MHALRAHRASRALLAWALVLALLAAQALGLAHRALHPGSPAATVVASERAPGDGAGPLFAGHGEGRDCRLFDAIGQDLLPQVPGLAAAPPPPGAWAAAAPRTGCPARPLAAFDARGPPAQG